MTLQDFNQNFIYTKDDYESWEILSPDSDNRYRGDCEDFALTLKYKVDGYKDNKLYFCKYKGEGHIVSKMSNGRWIDNITQYPVAKLGKEYTDFRRVYPIEIWIKLVLSKVRKWIH